MDGISIDLGSNMLLDSFFASLQAQRGNILNDKTLYLDTSSNSVKMILKKWRQLIQNDLAPTYTFKDTDAWRKNFKKGTVAMMLTTHSRWIECANVLGKDKVGVLPLPGAEKNGSLIYIHGIVISAKSTNRQLAIRFIKEELLNRDFQLLTMRNYGKIPSLIRNNPNSSKEWKPIFHWIKNSSTLPLYKDWSKFDEVFQSEIKSYLLGHQSINRTLSKITKVLNKIDKSSGSDL
jgi:ABC-type glycerol-3-phosphate transport system substrate-binding protein